MSDIQNAFTKEMSLAAMTKTRLVELAPILTNEQFTVFLNALMHYSLKIVDRNSDLLEATRTLLDCFVEDPISWMYKSDIAIEKARDAIAKATGAA
jgi:hypothetical protein